MGGIKQLVERNCLYCNKAFLVNPKAGNGLKKYCSMACWRDFNKSTGKGSVSRTYSRKIIRRSQKIKGSI